MTNIDHVLERAVTEAIHPPGITVRVGVAARAMCSAPGEAESCLCRLGMKRCIAMKVYGRMALAAVLALDRPAK